MPPGLLIKGRPLASEMGVRGEASQLWGFSTAAKCHRRKCSLPSWADAQTSANMKENHQCLFFFLSFSLSSLSFLSFLPSTLPSICIYIYIYVCIIGFHPNILLKQILGYSSEYMVSFIFSTLKTHSSISPPFGAND